MIKKIMNADGTVAKVVTVNDKPGLTQQHFRDQTNVNNIMKKYRKVPDPSIFVRSGKGVYGDFSGVVDYQTALDTVIKANDSFSQLDSQVRARFHNNPAQLLAFLNDSRNREEAISLGLIPKPEKKESPAPVVEQPKVAKKKTTIIEEE